MRRGGIADSFPPSSCAIVLGALLIYAGNTYRAGPQRWDDAYIAFRYAQHAALGRGLTWNAGGPPVEGFTSLLQVLLLAGGVKLGANPEQASVVIGVAAVVATLAMMIFILRRHFGRLHPAAALVLGLYLIDNTTATHTASGLETQLFVALLCGGYLAALSFIESPRWSSSLLMPVLIFLSVLCRPEGVLYGAALLGVLIVHALWGTAPRPAARSSLLKLAVATSALACLGLAYASWKLQYFGFILPNSFYVKSGRVSLAGWTRVAYYLAHVGLWLGPLMAAFWWLIGRVSVREALDHDAEKWSALARDEALRAKILATLAPPAVALLYYLTIIHETGGAHRFPYPTYFYLALAAAIFVTLSLRDVRVSRRQWYRFGAVGAAWIVILALSQGGWRASPPRSGFFEYHHAIASALKETGLGGGGTVLCDAAGLIPYVSGFNQVDRVGLTDNVLSGRKAMSGTEREAYLWSRGADVYVGYEPPASAGVQRADDDPRMRTPYVSRSLLGRRLTGIEDRIFVQDPDLLYARMKELRDNWDLVGEMAWPGWRIWRLKSFVYVRRNSPHADALLRSLRRITAVDPSRMDLDD